jgi:hypothetical protein
MPALDLVEQQAEPFSKIGHGDPDGVRHAHTMPPADVRICLICG